MATVVTTTTTTTATPLPTPQPTNHVFKRNLAKDRSPPEQQQEQQAQLKKTEARFSFLAELQGLGKSVPGAKKESPPKDAEEDEPDVPTVNPFKVLKPAGSNPRRVALPAAPAATGPTLADQVRERESFAQK